MSFVAAAIGGSAALGAGASIYSSNKSAGASKEAAALQDAKQNAAIQNLLGYGDEYKSGYDQIGQSYKPYVEQANRIGGASNDALYNLIQNPSSVRSLPGYQFALDEGSRAVDRSAAARGMDASGRTMKDLTRFGTGIADQTYGNQLQRLMALNGQGFSQGMAATGAEQAAYGEGLRGQLNARTTAYGGQMTNSGTLAQGDIAAANAQAAGYQGAAGALMKGAGMYAGYTGGYGGGYGDTTNGMQSFFNQQSASTRV